jgi:O-antigen/teichoic acid export membrane protein
MLMGELPRRREKGQLVAAALIAAAVASFILSTGFLLLAPRFGSHFAFVTGSLGRVVIFVIGVVLTGVSCTFDQACIGLLRGGLQLSRNLAFAIAKVAALPLSAIVLHDALGVGVMLSWVIGIVVSLLWTAIQLRRSGISLIPTPDWASLRRLGKVTMAHNWLNLAIYVPPTLLPVLVTAVVSPQANASFYVSWMIASFLYMIPASLSTVLFAVASADVAAMASKLRFTLRVSAYLGAPGMLVLFVGGHLLLGVFGKSYAHAGTVPLWLFAAAYVPCIPVSHYVAVCRASDRVSLAAVVLTTFSALEVVAAAAGGVRGGLTGLSLAFVGVKFVEGIVTAPAVIKAARARPRGNGDQPIVFVPDEVPQKRPPWNPADVHGHPAVAYESGAMRYSRAFARRQREGLDALIAISIATSTTGPFPMAPDYDLRPRDCQQPPQGYGGRPPGGLDLRGQSSALDPGTQYEPRHRRTYD